MKEQPDYAEVECHGEQHDEYEVSVPSLVVRRVAVRVRVLRAIRPSKDDFAKPPALREDSPSSTVPGGVRRTRVVRDVSPHPDPLPQGEGTACIAPRKADGPGLFSSERRVHPLPDFCFSIARGKNFHADFRRFGETDA